MPDPARHDGLVTFYEPVNINGYAAPGAIKAVLPIGKSYRKYPPLRDKAETIRVESIHSALGVNAKTISGDMGYCPYRCTYSP